VAVVVVRGGVVVAPPPLGGAAGGGEHELALALGGEHDRGHDCDEGAAYRCRRKRSGRGVNGATLPETSLVRP
jgi:hypothetical protein